MLKILTAGLLLVIFFNFLIFNSEPGVGFSLFIVLINCAVFALYDRNSKNSSLKYIFGITSSVFALLFAFRSNGIVQIIDIGSSIFFLLLNIYFSKTNLKFDFSYFNLITAPFKSGIKLIEGFVQSFSPQTWADHSSQKHVTSSLLRGLLIGVPVLAVLFIILSKADPVFENLTFNLLKDVWIRMLFSLVIFISVLSLGIIKIFESEKETEIKQVSAGKEYELLVILGGLVLLFGAFIFIQFKYLFSGGIGERELLSLGIKSLTFSEYVRKGFFELLLASVLSAGIVLYALQYIHKLKDKGKLLVQFLTSIVTLEVGLLLWSAAQRVFLYYDAHGLTRARVFGMFFLVWLAALLVILLIRILKDINSRIYLTLNIISTLLILILVNFISVDGLIAGSEHKPTVNNEVDYYYLSHLSPDAHQSWIPTINEAEQVYLNLKDKILTPEEYRVFYWHSGAIESLSSEIDYLKDKYGPEEEAVARHEEIMKTMDPGYAKQVYADRPLTENIYQLRKWQSMNLGEYQAYQHIKDHPEVFNKLPALLEGLRFIDSNIAADIRSSAVLDRSTSAPLSN